MYLNIPYGSELINTGSFSLMYKDLSIIVYFESLDYLYLELFLNEQIASKELPGTY